MEMTTRRVQTFSWGTPAHNLTPRGTIYNGSVKLPNSSRSLESAEGFLSDTKGNGSDFRHSSLNTTHVRRMSRRVGTTSRPSFKVALPTYHSPEDFMAVRALVDWNERSNTPEQYATSEKSFATTSSRSRMYRSMTLKQQKAPRYIDGYGLVPKSPRVNQSLKQGVVKHEKQTTQQRTNYISGFNQLGGGLNSQAQMSARLHNQVSVKKPLTMAQHLGADPFDKINEGNHATGHIQNECLKSNRATEMVNGFNFSNNSFNSTHSRMNSPQQYATSEKSLAMNTGASRYQQGIYRSMTLKQPVGAKYQFASAAFQPSPRKSQSLKQSVVNHEGQTTQRRTNCMSQFTQLDGGLNSQAQMSSSLNNQVSNKTPLKKITLDKALNLLDKRDEENMVIAANCIQNECLKNEDSKTLVHNMHGVKKLLQLLKIDSEEVQYAAAGALRNVVYTNKGNKKDVIDENGLDVILDALGDTSENETKYQLAGLLWNLSSDDTIKKCFNKRFLTIITNSILVPSSGLRASENPKDEMNAHPKAFLCATGCLRNLSSAPENVRREMRTCENLIDSLVHYIRETISSHKLNDKSTENCVCILQNLTYKFENDFISSEPQNETQQDTAPEMTTVGCFCHRRFKHTKDAKDKTDAENRCPPLIEDKEPHGAEWLWSKHIVKIYLILVDRSTESATREAAIRALQSLTAGKGALSKSVAIILQEDGLQKNKGDFE